MTTLSFRKNAGNDLRALLEDQLFGNRLAEAVTVGGMVLGGVEDGHDIHGVFPDCVRQNVMRRKQQFSCSPDTTISPH